MVLGDLRKRFAGKMMVTTTKFSIPGIERFRSKPGGEQILSVVLAKFGIHNEPRKFSQLTCQFELMIALEVQLIIKKTAQVPSKMQCVLCVDANCKSSINFCDLWKRNACNGGRLQTVIAITTECSLQIKMALAEVVPNVKIRRKPWNAT